MRRSRLLAIATLATTSALAVAVIGAAGPANAVTTVNYVALGDSYSAGVGAGNYYSSSGPATAALMPIRRYGRPPILPRPSRSRRARARPSPA